MTKSLYKNDVNSIQFQFLEYVKPFKSWLKLNADNFHEKQVTMSDWHTLFVEFLSEL